MRGLFRKAGLVFILSFLLCMVGSQITVAQDFPNKPVTLIVPFGPGGQSDLMARTFASVANDYLGQPILIVLKPGGKGIIGTNEAAKAAPDGYTLLSAGSGWNSAMPAIEGRSKGPDDMEAVCRTNHMAVMICARLGAPYKTLPELMEWVKANPGKLLVGSGGPYTPMQLFWEEVMRKTGVSVRFVSFSGGGQMVLAALGGHIDITGGTSGMLLPHIRAKKLIPLAWTDNERSPDFPDVPTTVEQGVNVTVSQWRGILAPKGTPRPIIDKLAEAFKKMSKDKSVLAMMKKTGQSVEFMGPDEFARYWRKDYEYYKKVKEYSKK